MEQRVAGDQHGAHEVVEEQVQQRTAVSLGRQDLVQHVAVPGTDPNADQRPEVGRAVSIATGTVGADVHNGVVGGFEPQGQFHLPEDLRPVGAVLAGAEVTAAGVDDQPRRPGRQGERCRSMWCAEPIPARVAASTWPEREGPPPAGGRSPARLHAAN